jgi:hypothetical protein
MKHDDYVKALANTIGDGLVKQMSLCSQTIKVHYTDLHVKYWCIPEFTIRLDKSVILPDGRYHLSRRRFDAMFLVVPTLNAVAQQWTFKVGIEVKATKSDLLGDEKIEDYLGWTDYFFVAIPDSLVRLAINKFKNEPRIGVISLDSGNIAKMPAWQEVPNGRKLAIMEQAFYFNNPERCKAKSFTV